MKKYFLSILILITTFALSQTKQMDDLKYFYSTDNNRLDRASDDVIPENWTTDLDNQSSINYGYNAIGQLTKDEVEGIKIITWNLLGLVQKIIKINGDTLLFSYNSNGKRISKKLSNGSSIQQTNYTYYADGNIAAIYKKNYNVGEEDITTVKIEEYSINSSSRLGIYKDSKEIIPYTNTICIYSRELQSKEYEVTDYLGNVRLVLTDQLLAFYNAEKLKSLNTNIELTNNFYSYGMKQPERYFSSVEFRYGVQGKESDVEIKGDGNSYDFGARILDPRLGKWLSIDPLAQEFPDVSPYCAMANNPTNFIDPDGNAPALPPSVLNGTLSFNEIVGELYKNGWKVIEQVPGKKIMQYGNEEAYLRIEANGGISYGSQAPRTVYTSTRPLIKLPHENIENFRLRQGAEEYLDVKTGKPTNNLYNSHVRNRGGYATVGGVSYIAVRGLQAIYILQADNLDEMETRTSEVLVSELAFRVLGPPALFLSMAGDTPHAQQEAREKQEENVREQTTMDWLEQHQPGAIGYTYTLGIATGRHVLDQQRYNEAYDLLWNTEPIPIEELDN